MSLILEALRKLEREKGGPERGVTVLAATPWPASGRRTRFLWPVAAVLLAAAGVAAGAWWTSDSKARATASSVGVQAPPPAPAPVVAPQWPSPPPLSHSVPVAREAPLRAAPSPSALAARPPETPIQLQAISVQDGRPVAILNDHLVHEGDRFDEVLVVRIGTADVEVEVRGQRRTLVF